MDDHAPTKPLLTTVKEAARMLAVSQRTIYRLIADGRLQALHVTADSTRIRVADIEAFLRGA